MRLPLLTTLLLTVLLSACAPTPTRPDGQALKIASWNLEHLAEADGLGCQPRSEADYATLRGYVERLDADVIAFQEVESVKAAQRVFSPDQYDILISTRPGGVRHGFCKRDATSGPTIRKQDLGFAIRKGLRYTRHPDVSAVAVGNPDLRWGVDVSIGSGHQAIRLLGLHLKSGCSAGNKSGACPVLFEQMPVLREWIVERENENSAYAVLGDWNRRLALPDDAAWQQLNHDLPGGAKLVDAAGGRGANCKKRYPDYIDHIIVGPSAAARLRAGSFEEFAYGVPEDRHPSDHCPIAVILQ